MNTYIFKEKDDIDSVFLYFPNFLSSLESLHLYSILSSIDYWYNSDRHRQQIFFQNSLLSFSSHWKHSWSHWSPHLYPFWLSFLQSKIESFLSSLSIPFLLPSFNSCLINKYNSGNDYIGHHRDNNPSLKKYPTIACLSIGSHRLFSIKRLKKYVTSSSTNFNILLESGSLLIMSGSSQKYFSHSILSDSSILNTRWSLTFRYLF